MSEPPPSPDRLAGVLASGLVARLIHDLAGPASGITSGMDLMAADIDPASRAEAMDLAQSSARDLQHGLELCRFAFTGSLSPLGRGKLQTLAQSLGVGRRSRLTFGPMPATLSGLAGQVSLILVQIAADGCGVNSDVALAVETRGAHLLISVVAHGARSALPGEAAEGLAGRPYATGLVGRWAPARFLHSVLMSAGGSIDIAVEPNGFRLAATVQA